MDRSPLHFLLFFLVNVIWCSSTLLVRHVRDFPVNGSYATNPESDKPLISAMHIESKVNARYGEVLVKTHVENTSTRSKETTFFFFLPLSAFISKFSMTINGETYIGTVMGKDAAKTTYEEAKENNETAGHLEQDTMEPTTRLDTDRFTVSVNLAANASAVFELRYQELLERRNGEYKQVISFKPNQVIPDFKIVCSYNEPQDFELFSFILPKGDDENELPREEAELSATPSKRILTYVPSNDTQISFDPVGGISGDFIVSYDVKHSDDGGLVVFTEDGYVVSYYSPSVPDSEILPKDIVFITDISGSMSGEKIKQARRSLIETIDKLRSIDRFNIILFDDKVELYAEGFLQANEQNKQDAKVFAEKNVQAKGGTNINKALQVGVRMFDSQNRHDSRGNIIVFLTDGQPTVGTTDLMTIRSNVRKSNYYRDESDRTLLKTVIYCLAYGFDVNFDFLSNLAEENGANARRIYERVDAKDQLVYFFEELSDPYLSQVSFSLCQTSLQGTVTRIILEEDKISRNVFPYYFSGSELIVVAKMSDVPAGEWQICMSGTGGNGIVDTVISPETDNAVSLDPHFIENLYAYKQIKHYLMMSGKELNESLALWYTDLALNLSLKYQFVTPLTSMVVTFAMKKQHGLPQSEYDVLGSGMPTGVDLRNKYKPLSTSAVSLGSEHHACCSCVYLIATMLLFWERWIQKRQFS